MRHLTHGFLDSPLFSFHVSAKFQPNANYLKKATSARKRTAGKKLEHKFRYNSKNTIKIPLGFHG